MKRLLLLLSMPLFFADAVNAQLFSDFGQVSPADLELKTCAFDTEAGAVVLLDEAVSDYDDEYHLLTNHHLRIKILKESGIEEANIAISYQREHDFEYIDAVRGMVINTDVNGNPEVTELDKKAIFDQKTSEIFGEVRFTFPNVRVGSIIEYEYRSTMKSYGGLDNWYFQRELPTVKSKYSLTVVPNYEFTYQVYKSPGRDISVNSNKDDGRIVFEMDSIPGLRSEPYMDARGDYLQRVNFQLSGYGSSSFDKQHYMTSWQEVTRELMGESDFWGQLGKNIPGTDDFIRQVKTESSPEKKMRMVYDYVRHSMTWNGVYALTSINGVKEAWEKKTAASGDINLILINLLKDAGLDAWPMLISERRHGRVNTNYPFIGQFNTLYAAVFIGDDKYYLNALDEFTPPQLIPYNILNTTAFIVKRKGGGLVKINDEKLKYREGINISADVTPDGQLKGSVYMISRQYARVSRVADYSAGKDHYVNENFRKLIPSGAIDSFSISHVDNDSLPLEEQFRFHLPMNHTGNYTFVPLNLFSHYESNPFLADNRFTDINFGYKQAISLNFYLKVPDADTLDALPKSLQLVMPDKSISFTRRLLWDPNQRVIACRITIDIEKSLFDVNDYALLKEFYKKMFGLLNEQVVLKTK